MVVGGQYDKGGSPLDFSLSLSLLQMLYQSQVFFIFLFFIYLFL